LPAGIREYRWVIYGEHLEGQKKETGSGGIKDASTFGMSGGGVSKRNLHSTRRRKRTPETGVEG